MKTRLAIFSIVLTFFSSVAIAQDLNKSLIFSEGDRLFESSQYIKAMRFYKEVLDKEPGHMGATFQLGECYRLIFDYESALHYYKIVSEKGDDRFPLASYYYGDMLKHDGDFNMALQLFDKFTNHIRSLDKQEDKFYRKYYKQAKIEKEGCLMALNDLTNPKPDHNFQVCSDQINTEYMDFAAFTYDDGGYLCLTSSRSTGRGNLIDYRFGESFADIFRYKRDGDNWAAYEGPDRLEKMINTKWGDGSGTFNRAGTKFYYTNCNEKLGDYCHIYVSIKDGTWSEPKPLGESINMTGFDSRHPNVSPNGDTLFFASNRPGGYGEYDIWMSLNAGGENWSQPENLGGQINTPFFEVSPFYDVNQNALFFSSDGHRGYGGFDIYMAKGLSFLDPEIFNPGAPFNSYKDEVFMFIAGNKGYLSSNRDGGFGKLDIYEFDILTEEAIITEISSDEAVAGRNSLFIDDYDFDSDQEQEINEIISHFLASKEMDVELALTDELSNLYKRLSLDDRERINRIVLARVRKLSEKDLQALRIEDEFYYRELKSTDRSHMDNLITRYIEEKDLALSVHLDKSEEEFYKNLSPEDRERADHLIAKRIKQSNEYRFVPTTYLSLAKSDQNQVDNLAYKYFEEKTGLEKLTLNPTQSYYLKGLEDSKRQEIFLAVKEKLLDLANDPKYGLSEDDRIFYQNLSSEHLEALRAIASSFILFDVQNLHVNLDPKLVAIYKLYNSDQQARLNRVLAKIISNTLIADLYYAEANLDKGQRLSASTINPADVEQFIKRNSESNMLDVGDKVRIKRFLTATAPTWKPNKAAFLSPSEPDKPTASTVTTSAQELAKGDQAAIVQQDGTGGGSGVSKSKNESVAVTTAPPKGSTIKETQGGAPTQLANENTQVSANETKGAVSENTTEATNQSVAQTTIKPIVEDEQKIESLSSADISFYENKEPTDQKRMDRILAMEYMNIAYKDVSLVKADDDYFKILTVEEKMYIKLLTQDLKEGEIMTLAEQANLKDAFSYYSNLAPSLKGKWNRLVARETLIKEGNKFKISTADATYRRNLSAADKETLNNIKDFRFANERILSEHFGVESNDTPSAKVNFDVAKFNNDNFRYISVSGALYNNQDGQPLGNFPVKIVDKEGNVVAMTTTSSNGAFDFADVPKGDYKVVSGKEQPNKGIESTFFVKDLNVQGSSKGKYANSKLTNIYFDFDAFSLRPEVLVTLREIAAVYKKSKIKIELRSYTDNIGPNDYNLDLSRKRNNQTIEMLKALGVKGEDIEWMALGKNNPAAPNNTAFGRQFNRRIEIRLKSDEEVDFEPLPVYLIRPKGTLYSIAKNFGIEISTIQQANGLISNDINAYSPLRIPNPKGVRPNLDMLVELNESLANSNNLYKVKKGENVSTIASKYNIPEELIMEMNDLTGLELTPGQEIKIYIRGN